MLAGFDRLWFVSGGWAIDLFLDQTTRPHEDLEIGILRADQAALWEHLAGWGLFKSARPGLWDPWQQGEQLELPVHQLLARPPGGGPPAAKWEPEPGELQFFLNDVDHGVWVCRRDSRVTRPASEVSTTAPSGTPIIAPEIQLLYKAKHHVDKDEHDFRATVGRLTVEQRGWLRAALEIVHPGDPWLKQLV